jgi:hypothetical protein
MLEEACSDTLIILDTAYHPSSRAIRQKGILELLASSTSEDHLALIGRNSFTRALVEQLRMRASQRVANVISAAELHCKLLSNYPKIVSSRHPERQDMTNLPSPLYMQMSGNSRLPSITLSPVQSTRSETPLYGTEGASGSQLTLSFRLADESLNIENWVEWLRMMPDGIRAVNVEGPYPRTSR